MFSLAINFEIYFKDALETPALLAVFVVVAIIVVTRRHRRRSRTLNNESFNMAACCRKPIPVENEENSWNVSDY